MGYYTSHKLTLMPESDSIIAKLRERHEDAAVALDEDGDSNESCKWYDHNDNLMKFSKEFPNHIFLLEGDGEGAGDAWKTYYKNGKLQEIHAELVFADAKDPFIETQEQGIAARKDELEMEETAQRESHEEAVRLKREKIDTLKEELNKLENE